MKRAVFLSFIAFFIMVMVPTISGSTIVVKFDSMTDVAAKIDEQMMTEIISSMPGLKEEAVWNEEPKEKEEETG